MNHLISRCSGAVCMSATNRMLCSVSTSRCQSSTLPLLCSCWYVSLRLSKSFAILAYWSDKSLNFVSSTLSWGSLQKNSSKFHKIIISSSLDRPFERLQNTFEIGHLIAIKIGPFQNALNILTWRQLLITINTSLDRYFVSTLKGYKIVKWDH